MSGNGNTSGDGTVYLVDESAPILSSNKKITAFDFDGLTPNVTGIVDETDHAISVTVPFGTDITNLVPTIVISDKASVAPNNNLAQDFSSPVTYTVTAEDKSTQDYIVTVNIDPDPNSATTQ